jgi:hypothetical protein
MAINEQRFATNIKSVMSTDSFGEIAEGNVGDFAKFLPGVTIDYGGGGARGISVGGMPTYTTPAYARLRLRQDIGTLVNFGFKAQY